MHIADGIYKSAAAARIAEAWAELSRTNPPLKASAGAMPIGDYSIISRDDGSKQWAYKGRPLYNWKNDKKPGDITGDGFLNGAWRVAQPQIEHLPVKVRSGVRSVGRATALNAH